MYMERTAEVIRGWPYDGARETFEPIQASTTLQNGDWVYKTSSGNVVKTSTTAVGPGAGLVVVGNGDSASAANTNDAVVLWGNFVARISNFDTTVTFVPGAAVTSKNGIITLAAVASGTGSSYVPGDPVVGTVLSVTAASTGINGQTANIVIQVA